VPASAAGRPSAELLAEEAVATARASLGSAFPRHARAAVLDRAAAAVEGDAEAFARTICGEVGKPISAARAEVERAVVTLRESAAVSRSLAGQEIPFDAAPGAEGKLGFVHRVPLGLVVAITPFNFPLNLACHKLGPALAAGNAVVLKPAEQAPKTARRLLARFVEAGLPEGRLTIAEGDGEVGAALVRRDDVEAITFTGSSDVGWGIRRANPRAKVLLELGSTAPLVVCEDADVGAAARATSRHGFSFSGQSCISVQRVIVHRAVLPAYIAELVAATRAVVVGDPADEATVVGPLIDAAAADRVLEWISEAVDGGAHVLAGGSRLDERTLEPSLVVDPPTTSRLWREEVFGPVVALRAVDDLDEAIWLANDSEFGLQAGVFTAGLAAALRCAQELEFGSVLINEAPTFRVDHQPYGGLKRSGTGKEGPAWAARELSEERLVCFQGIPA
jgi:acyl-CoA reductase-like NAD-dependent aldehyde dehydrogenase